MDRAEGDGEQAGAGGGDGAGLVGADLRFCRGTDVVERSGGVIVGVKGRRPRDVPVLAAYHDRLLATAAYFSDRYLIAGFNPEGQT